MGRLRVTSHYRQEVKIRSTPVCPFCNQLAQEHKTQYGIRCTCYECNLWSWDRYPLVDQETHTARRLAHLIFDSLWKQGIMSRGMAYRALQLQLNLKEGECHIKLMDKETARRVPEAIAEILTATKERDYK